MMSYGYVYVASVSMGADKNQLMKACMEADNYNGPSLILAYAPCINQGIKIGMGKSQEESKRAVESGYWPLYRYNPDLEKENKNPFQLDSKAPNGKINDFINGEIRYASLSKLFPKEAEVLLADLEKHVDKRYQEMEFRAKNASCVSTADASQQKEGFSQPE